MDFFGVVAMLWLFSAAAAALVGRFRGRGGDAMTLGVLLGPVGLLLTLFWIGRNVRRPAGRGPCHPRCPAPAATGGRAPDGNGPGSLSPADLPHG